MGRKLTAASILLVAGFGLWLLGRGSMKSENGGAAHRHMRSHKVDQVEDPDVSPGFRTKASVREIGDAHATHRPEQLKDFMLPEVVIDGLDLDAALRRLLAAYQDACLRSGETPLALRFAVPPGSDRKLQLRLNSKSFRTSVQLLAALSGMKVNREGLEYRFTRLEDKRRTTERILDVPPDFQSALHELIGSQDARMSLRDLVARLGLELDPSTRLTLGSIGKLALETDSSADASAVSSLAGTLAEQLRLQHKFASRVVELAPGSEWVPPGVTQMNEAQLQMFMREMAQAQGTDLLSLPSITARSGQTAEVEITRELITPTDETATTFESHDLGHVMHVQGSALGFGHDLSLRYTNTTGDIDPATGKPVIRKQTDVEDSGYSGDGGTRFVVQIRPDGSRAIVLVTSVMIDATGRPLN